MNSLNRVIITGRVIKVSDICFDYYNKLKPYVIIKVVDLDNEENIFECILYDRVFEKYFNYIYYSSNVLIEGSIVKFKDKDFIYIYEIYSLK